MTQEQFDKIFNDLSQIEEKHKVKISLDRNKIIDENHLHCAWYGGYIGEIVDEDGFAILIEVHGEICVSGAINKNYLCYYDKCNRGAVYELACDYNLTDDDYVRLLGKGLDRIDENATEDYLYAADNNWVEFNILPPDGDLIDMCYADNVLDDNVLSSFTEEGVSELLDILAQVKDEYKSFSKKFS